MGSNWKERGRAAAVHLMVSLAIAALAAVLVLLVWFPDPYRQIAGGIALFGLLVGVDVILGPALTFVVFNRAKPRTELVRDLAIIGVLQLAALGYGLATAFQARPVYLVYEVDRFRIVRAADIEAAELPLALPQLRELPWHGVRVIGTRSPRSPQEMLASIDAAVAGRDIGVRPAWWQPIGPDNERQIRQHARSLDMVRARAGARAGQLERLVAASAVPPAQVIGLPVAGHVQDDWAVLLDARDLRVIGALRADLF
jgi:hypothetical protein